MKFFRQIGKTALILYLMVAFLLTLDLLANSPSYQFLLKPCLAPLLMLYAWGLARGSGDNRLPWLLAALFFSFLGDVFLLPWPERDLFLLGLGSFLVTQVIYAYLFFTWPGAGSEGLVARRRVWLVPFLVYGFGLLGLLWPGIGPGLQIPVVLYSLVITLMAIGAFNLGPVLRAPFGLWLAVGALLFLVSDSLIGLRQFGPPDLVLPASTPAIMLTYMGAQGLLAWSLTRSMLLSPVLSDRSPVPVSPDGNDQPEGE